MNKIYTHCFDDGHGGSDPGAIGQRGTHESDISLAIGKIAGRIMLEQGQKVIYTRTTDKYLTLAQRADIANKGGCRTFTSIHCNSFSDVSANGTETWSYPGSVEGAKLSKLVQSELIKSIKLTNRGCKTANFGVLRMSSMTAILVETAFISNANEENLLLQNSFREKVAESIVRGIFEYLGLIFKEKETPKVVASPVATNVMYRVVTGSFADRSNADARIAALKKVGFESFIEIK
jgi:N-acetylmuramoyl-L-alanine amidase